MVRNYHQLFIQKTAEGLNLDKKSVRLILT